MTLRTIDRRTADGTLQPVYIGGMRMFPRTIIDSLETTGCPTPVRRQQQEARA